MSIIQFSINLKIGKLKEYKVFRLTMSSLDHIFYEQMNEIYILVSFHLFSI